MDSQEVIFSAVGDISLGDYPFCIGYGVGSIIKERNISFIFEKVRHYFETSDITFGNLETILSFHNHNKKELKSIELRGSPHSIEGLIDCNFKILNIANNHILQHGEKAFLQTIDLLEANQIKPLGLSGEHGWHSKPVIMEINGIKFGFLGYAFETDKYFKGELKYAFGRPDDIEKDIEILRADVDYLILSCHWGLEFMDRPSVSVIRLARRLIDKGVDIILGHHPHVLQGIEYYKHGIICYSLGNFVFDMLWDQKFIKTIIVEFVFNKSKSISFKTIPVIINSFYQPEVVSNQAAMQHNVFMEELSRKIHKELEGDTEYNSYNYYIEYEKLRKRNRYASYIYFFKNIQRSSVSMVSQIIKRRIFHEV